MTVQNLLLATDGFISLFAIILFTCAHLQATRLRHQAAQHHALTCGEDTNCVAAPIPGIFSQSVSNCNLSIAIVSNIVFVSRLTIRRLETTPRSIHIIYDILMGPIWLLGLIQTIHANSQQSLSAEIPSACALTACALVICVAAASVHFVRISTHVLSYLGYITQDEDISPSEIAQDKAWLLEHHVARSDQPLSPVLAFFP